jgi:hypothetical protein
LIQLTQMRIRSGLLLEPRPTLWAVIANGPWPGQIFVVSSLTPEHVVKYGNFDFRLGYQPIGIH